VEGSELREAPMAAATPSVCGTHDSARRELCSLNPTSRLAAALVPPAQPSGPPPTRTPHRAARVGVYEKLLWPPPPHRVWDSASSAL